MARIVRLSLARKHTWQLVVLFVLLGLVTFVHEYTWAQTQVVPLPQTPTSILKSQWIDRSIPSKAEDLFVVLKNGLTVLIRESHGSKVVSCQVLVETGSIYEGEKIGGGLSHYLEHVVSGGTTSKYTEVEINNKLQAMGGATNAHTSYDDSVYFVNTTRPHYQQALELLVAYVTDCKFNETEYQREKGVILEEFKLAENNPSKQL